MKLTTLQLNKKKKNYFIDLFDDMFHEDNPFNDANKTEDNLLMITCLIPTKKK